MDDLTKIIAALAGIFALYKVFVDVILSRSYKRREEYGFTKQFLNDLNEDSIHLYIKEKGILALTGKIYSVDEMKSLLHFSRPSKAIEALSSAGKCIKYDSETNEFVWNGVYKNKTLRRMAKYGFLILYVIFCFAGLFPITQKGFSFFPNFTFSLTISSSIIIAFVCLAKHENMKEATEFMNLKEKTT